MHIEEKEIEEELKSQGVIKVVRMRKKIGEQLVPLGTLIVTFNQCRLPNFLSAGWLSLKVKPYIPSPLRCYHCQLFGHLSQKCKDRINEKPATCSNCGKEAHGTCNAIPSCVNCGEKHPSSSKNCVKFIFEKEVQAIRTLEKIPFKEARKKALEKQIKPGELFSTVLRRTKFSAEDNTNKNTASVKNVTKESSPEQKEQDRIDDCSRNENRTSPSTSVDSSKRKESPDCPSNEKRTSPSTSMESLQTNEISRSENSNGPKVNNKRELTPERKPEENLYRKAANYVASKGLMLASRSAPKIKRLNPDTS